MNPLRFFFSLMLTTWVAGTAVAQFGSFLPDSLGEDQEQFKVKGSLISELKNFKPGEPFWVALQLDHEPGWHTYYSNPGVAGTAPDLQWELSAGWDVGEPQFAIPHRLKMGEDMTYSYEGTTFVLVRMTPPRSFPLGQRAELKLKANWQACNDRSCIFQPGPSPADFFEFSVEVKSATEPSPSEFAGLFEKARSNLPREPKDWEVKLKNAGSELILEIKPRREDLPELEGLYFFASEPGILDPDAEQLVEKREGLYLLRLSKHQQAGKISDLSGVLVASSGFDFSAKIKGLEIQGLKPSLASEAELYDDLELGPFLLVLGGMMLGGLILNLMPCVFPVIGLKIMGFVNQAGEDRKKVILHGLIFAAGVLISFWLLSGLLLALREQALRGEGSEVGWGYQLQNPYLVWGLLLVMFILGLNMFGLFEIGSNATSVGGKLQAKQGLAGSFFAGVLATVVATPCSAPFLGAAIGAAFALPPVKFMLAFTAMALGLALPYLVLSSFPDLVKKLPRPGAWMESFKQGMSFLLFGTAGYLLWVYLSQNTSFHGLWIMLGLAAIGAGAWVYGRWLRPVRTRREKLAGGIVSILLLAAGLYATRPVAEIKVPWEAWSQSAVDQALEAGRPVYVDFTAKWCLTCQANKARAYTEPVVRSFAERNVLMLKADKTNASPEIEKALKKLGRTAIPVNVLYIPAKAAPIITPEILGPKDLLELLEAEIPHPSQ